MRCWWCGVEPLDVETFDLCSPESARPIRQIVHARWPVGDHTHAETAPTAEELAKDAYRMLRERTR